MMVEEIYYQRAIALATKYKRLLREAIMIGQRHAGSFAFPNDDEVRADQQRLTDIQKEAGIR